FNEKIQFQADEDLEKQLKKALIQYNKSKGETVASIDADKMKNSTEGMTTSIVDIGRELKDNNQDYKAKFKGLDFYPSTFVLDSNPDEKFRFMIVTDLYVDEIVYDENEKAPDLKNYNLLTIYKVIYDEKDEEWKVDGIGDEEQVKKYYDDLHDEEVEKYRVESPKIITNEW